MAFLAHAQLVHHRLNPGFGTDGTHWRVDPEEQQPAVAVLVAAIQPLQAHLAVAVPTPARLPRVHSSTIKFAFCRFATFFGVAEDHSE